MPLEYSYIHSGKAGISTAFEIREKAEIILKIPRSVGTLNFGLEIFYEDTITFAAKVQGEWCGISGCFDEYIFQIPSSCCLRFRIGKVKLSVSVDVILYQPVIHAAFAVGGIRFAIPSARHVSNTTIKVITAANA